MYQTLNSYARATIASVSLSLCAAFLPSAQADDIAPMHAKADLQRLYSGLQSAEANLFAETPKAVFDRHYEELMARYNEPISKSDLYRDLQKFAALTRHGHTRLDGLNPAWSELAERDGLVFPLGFNVHQGEVIVASAPRGSRVEPGDRITAINGKTNPIWLSELTAHISAETPSLAYALLGQGEMYYFWLAYGEQASFDITLDRDGQSITTKLAAVTLTELDNNIELEAGFELSGRSADIVADNIGYLRPGPFYHFKAETPEDVYNADALAEYVDFIDASYERFLAAGIEHLILDLRDNPGGDASFSDPVIAWFATEPFSFASEFRIRVSDETTASNQARLETTGTSAASISQRFADLFATAKNGDNVLFDIPKTPPRQGTQFTGTVHVLVNRYSYSNAVNAAALIQDYGFGTLYGEPTRDMATTYGAMEHFVLPHSGFKVGYPKAHIIRPNGETKSHPVTPDIMLAVPGVRGATDIMLDAVMTRISHSK